MIVRAGTTLTWTVAGNISGTTVTITDTSSARWFAEYVTNDGWAAETIFENLHP